MRLRARRALLLVLALALAGCTQTGVQRGPADSSTAVEPQSSSTVSETELAGLKRAAGIEDCPPSDTSVAPLPDGLPDLTLECLGGGRPVRLAGLRGQPVVINVWGQWCPPCRKESPYLTTVSKQAKGKVLVLGIDYNDPRPELAIQFADEAGWTVPQLVDLDKQVSAPLQVAGPPLTVFVDADGTIVYRHSGPFTSTEQFRNLITTKLGVTL